MFNSCDFTGCQFIGVNLYGASFSGCKFDYATFEKTIVDRDILDCCFCDRDNLKLKFARTLRMNYQQLGDSEAADEAMEVELEVRKSHLYKAWSSNKSYYRGKYPDWKRVKKFFEWLSFKVLDFIWGNGESLFKLVRSILLSIIVMSLIDAIWFSDPSLIRSYWHSFLSMPGIFLGVSLPNHYPNWYLAFIVFLRLVAMGFLMSIIIKKFNRR